MSALCINRGTICWLQLVCICEPCPITVHLVFTKQWKLTVSVIWLVLVFCPAAVKILTGSLQIWFHICRTKNIRIIQMWWIQNPPNAVEGKNRQIVVHFSRIAVLHLVSPIPSALICFHFTSPSYCLVGWYKIWRGYRKTPSLRLWSQTRILTPGLFRCFSYSYLVSIARFDTCSVQFLYLNLLYID